MQWFVFGQNIAKFQPKQINLNLYKGDFMEKLAQICQILKKKKSKSQDFYDKFKWVAKNIVEFWFFSTFISSI